MIPTKEEQLMQDLALRQALLEALPDLALEHGVDPAVTQALAGRLQIPTLTPDFVPEEDPCPAPEPLFDTDGPVEILSERAPAWADTMAEQLQHLSETAEAERGELAALRRAFAEFSAATQFAAADRVLLSVIRVLDAVEAALRPEDEEKLACLRQEHAAGAALAHHYMTELQGVRQDLLELLYQNDTEPFTCGGQELEPQRQQVLARKTASYTTDAPEGELRLESRRPGYARGGRVLRKEQVWAVEVQPRWLRDGLEQGQHEPPLPQPETSDETTKREEK